MKQRDSNSAPDRAALEDEARASQAHPDFDRAVKALCQGMIDTHARPAPRQYRPRPHFGLGDCGADCLSRSYQARGDDLVGARCGLLAAGVEGGEGRHQEPIVLRADRKRRAPMNRRATRLRPTQLLLDIQTSENIVARLAALEIVQPLPLPAHEWGRRRSVMLAFYGGNVEAFARHRFRLYEGFPEIQAFMDRACGYLVLLDMLQKAGPASSAGVPTTVLPSALAPRLNVSRTHINKLLATAQDEGWLKVGPKRSEIFLEPTFYRRLRDWVALEFVWTWWLVRAA